MSRRRIKTLPIAATSQSEIEAQIAKHVSTVYNVDKPGPRGIRGRGRESERYWEGERDVWVSVHARLVVSFLPVTNEGRWLLARGGQRGGRRERGECDALSCPLARLLLIKNHNAPPSLCAVGRMHHVQNVCESHRGSIRGACHVRCIMHSEHTRNNNAFTPSSGHYQDGILPWLGFFWQTTGRQGKCELQVFSAV